MKDGKLQVRTSAAYVACIRSVGEEVDRGIAAVCENRIADLEESIATEQALVASLEGVTKELAGTDGMPGEIYEEAHRLRIRIGVFASLLRHSSRCAGQRATLLASLHGQETTGAGWAGHTLSCLM